MKMKFPLSSVSMLGLLLMMQQSLAGGYLTNLRSGIEVTDYMVNNNTGSGNIGGLTIWVSGISNPDGCTSTDKVHIKNTAPGYKEMVAAVMSAVAQGKRIGFHSSGCEGLPFWGGGQTYPMVSDIWVAKSLRYRCSDLRMLWNEESRYREGFRYWESDKRDIDCMKNSSVYF